MPAELRIRGLTKVFILHNIGERRVVALDGVDIEVLKGQHVALAGDSGAGKSTLLRCVYRTCVATGGSIRYRGTELTTLSDSEMADLRELHIGYVSQFLRAEPRRGVLETVARSGMRGGLDSEAAEQAGTEALKRVGIGEALWMTYPALLSGGEKQRVGLAAAIVRAPSLLLLDEPVASLDPANRESVLELVASLGQRGVTVLSVFHDTAAIARLADRVVLLRGGRVVDQGPPNRILPLLAPVPV